MAIDNKYGRVTLERGSIGEDEPVFIFRAGDPLVPKVLMYYHLFCWKAGSPQKHLSLILDSVQKIEKWQKKNWNLVRKFPTSDGYVKEPNESS